MLEEKSMTPTAPSSPKPADLASFKLVSTILALTGLVAITFYLVLYFQTGSQHWQMLASVGFIGLGLGCLAVAYSLARRKHPTGATALIFLGLALAYGGSELVLSGATWYILTGAGLLILMAGWFLLPRRWLAWLVAGLFAALVGLINHFEPWPRYDAAQSFPVSVFAAITGFPALAGLLWRAFRTFKIGIIRTRLFMAFITIVLVPVILIIAISVLMGLRNGQQQIINQLGSVATLKQAEIETWVQSLKLDLESEAQREQALQRMRMLLEAPDRATPALPGFQDSAERQWLFNSFQQAVALRPTFDEFFLLDLGGRVILSSDTWQEGKIYRTHPFFREGLKDFYLQPPQYYPSFGQALVIAALPVKDLQGQPVGVLAGRTSLARLSEILKERAGLGATGETYLIGRNTALLTQPLFAVDKPGEIYLRSSGLKAALQGQANGAGLDNDYDGTPSLNVYRWLPDLQVVLVAEQDQAEAFNPTYLTLGINAAVALAAVLLAGVAALFITRSIANPLIDLADTAGKIAAGNLRLAAPVARTDEIGLLAQAFNSMTAQLRGLIDSLEERVTSRTQRLEIVALLSERLAAILDFDALLVEMVNQVKDNFDYYHVHVYLFDERRERLVVAAGTGPAGEEMKARGHSIPADAPTSLVARAARTGQIVRVDNVREAPDWLPNPLLPDTYAEMAVPIILGSEKQVVGVLDVQEDTIGGLDEGDASLLRSLANQVSVAIRNARLFQQVETSLVEAQVAQRRYQEQAWSDVIRSRRGGKFQAQRAGAPVLDDAVVARLEAAALDQAGPAQVPVQASGETDRPALVAPIRLNEQTIGVIQVHAADNSGEQPWQEWDLALIQAVADQVAQTAENIRLFEEARERFSREQAIRQVADRLRIANSLDALLETAARELGQRLGVRHTVLELGVDTSGADSTTGQPAANGHEV